MLFDILDATPNQPWIHYAPHAGIFLSGVGIMVKFGLPTIVDAIKALKHTDAKTDIVVNTGAANGNGYSADFRELRGILIQLKETQISILEFLKSRVYQADQQEKLLERIEQQLKMLEKED